MGKSWMAKGVQSVGGRNIGYDYGYLYVAGNSSSGRVFGLILPSMTVESMTVFIGEFRSWLAANDESEAATLLVLDGAGSHRSERFSCGAIDKQLLPPYSPELNPVKRLLSGTQTGVKEQGFIENDVQTNSGANPFRSELPRSLSDSYYEQD